MQNLNTVTEVEKWEYQCKKNIKFRSNTIPKEKWYKMLYHCYIIPVMIAKMSNSFLANCEKCSEKTESFFHMWWHCCRAQQY